MPLVNEDKGSVTLVPYGSIPDRMLAMASAISYFSSIDKPLHIIWFRNEEVEVGYERLFSVDLSVQKQNISISNARFKDKLFYDIPTLANLYLPALHSMLVNDAHIHAAKYSSIEALRNDLTKELSSSNDAEIWLGLDRAFYNTPNMFELLAPSVEVVTMLRSFVSGWTNKVIGVHIARTKEMFSWRHNPTELFIRRMQKLIEADSEVHFFLTTDNYDDRDRIATIFGSRVFAPKSQKEPGTISEAVQTVAEMLALSKTEYILGNKENSFCQVASTVGEIAIEQISIYA